MPCQKAINCLKKFLVGVQAYANELKLPLLYGSIEDMVELKETDFVKTDLDTTKYMKEKDDGPYEVKVKLHLRVLSGGHGIVTNMSLVRERNSGIRGTPQLGEAGIDRTRRVRLPRAAPGH